MAENGIERKFEGELRLLDLGLRAGISRIRRAVAGIEVSVEPNMRGVYNQIAWMSEDRRSLVENRGSILDGSVGGIVALPSGRAVDLTVSRPSLIGRARRVVGRMING